MSPISFTAEAGAEIIQKLATGELEVHGILLRDTAGKKFRYIIKGFENLPKDTAQLSDLPPLEPLRSVMNVTQLLQIVSVAQNAAIAASLRRIEERLTAIGERLTDIDDRLKLVQTTGALILNALHTQPVSRLKAAKTAAGVAWRDRDRTALIALGKDAEQAFHDLQQFAGNLVRKEEDGLPVALRLPMELADLYESAADAAYVASAIWIALNSRGAAATVMQESAEALQSTRRKLASVFSDPELMQRRMRAGGGNDDKILIAAQRLQSAMHWSAGRAVMIEQGLFAIDFDYLCLDRTEPAKELAFVPIVIGEASGSQASGVLDPAC